MTTNTEEATREPIRYCPIHGDLLAGPLSRRCREALTGHALRVLVESPTDEDTAAERQIQYDDGEWSRTTVASTTAEGRMVTTKRELEALPTGSVVRPLIDGFGAGQRAHARYGGGWVSTGFVGFSNPSLPARVLFDPARVVSVPPTPEPEWEWMVRSRFEPLDRVIETGPTDEETARIIATDAPEGLTRTIHRRRPAGPWLPVTETPGTGECYCGPNGGPHRHTPATETQGDKR